MKILSIRSAFYTPALLTAARFLPAAGVEADLIFRTDQNPSTMLREGSLDFAQHAPSAAMVEISKGIADTPVHIASINERDGFLLIGREPDPAFEWRKLEGRTVVPASFAVQPEACLRYALHRQGVDAARVALVEGLDGMAAAAEAFANGRGDYVQLQDPMARSLVGQGKGHLVAQFGPAIGPIAFSSIACGRRTLDERPDTVRAFMLAYRAARRWIDDADPREIRDAIAPWFANVDQGVLLDAVAGYKSLGTWTRDTAIDRQAFTVTNAMMRHSAALTGITRDFDYDECCDDSFAVAVDRGG
ncbi:MAG: ABC transporter substrate-binding protein [Burkholderiaceae bacterium]